MLQSNVDSRLVAKVNFMDPEKKADKIAEVKSKAYNRQYRDKSIGVIAEIQEAQNLNVQFTDTGLTDVTSHLIGHDVNIRFTIDQWKALNARFHQMDAIGAYVTITIDGNVEYGDLTVGGEDVQSFTVYTTSVDDVNVMELARVGTPTSKDDFFEKLARDKGAKADRAAQARERNRANTQTTAAREGTETSSRVTAKV